jgi:ABC-type glycerol-3-phosphate transport system permease component
MKKDRILTTSILYIIGIIVAVIFLFPFYFSTISAFKSNGEIMKDALAFPTEFYVDSFKLFPLHYRLSLFRWQLMQLLEMRINGQMRFMFSSYVE